MTAANILGQALKDRVHKGQSVIPRGGVITADVVARKISASKFDIVIPRKLADPDNHGGRNHVC